MFHREYILRSSSIHLCKHRTGSPINKSASYVSDNTNEARCELLLDALQVQASAWSRWRFGDKQAKPSEVQTSGAEIFIMLPLGVIAVGELSEGEEVSFIHQCVWRGVPNPDINLILTRSATVHRQ